MVTVKVGDRVKYIGAFYLTLQGVRGVVESVGFDGWAAVRFPEHQQEGRRCTCEKLLPCLQKDLMLVE